MQVLPGARLGYRDLVVAAEIVEETLPSVFYLISTFQFLLSLLHSEL